MRYREHQNTQGMRHFEAQDHAIHEAHETMLGIRHEGHENM